MKVNIGDVYIDTCYLPWTWEVVGFKDDKIVCKAWNSTGELMSDKVRLSERAFLVDVEFSHNIADGKSINYIVLEE